MNASPAMMAMLPDAAMAPPTDVASPIHPRRAGGGGGAGRSSHGECDLAPAGAGHAER